MFRQLRPLQVVFDVLVALGFALVALPAELVTSAAPGTEWVAVVLVLIMGAAVAVRRLSPGLSLGVAWTGALLQMTAERNPGFVDIAIFAVLYVTAAYGSRLVFWAGLASVGVGSAAITIYLFRWGLIGQFSWSDLPSAVAILIAALFGAQSVGRSGGRLPMTIVGAADPVPVRYTVPVPSAQVKSAVLLAGLNAPGQTIVIEKEATRDHTERMLAGFGAQITTEDTDEGRVITLTGRPELIPQTKLPAHRSRWEVAKRSTPVVASP